MARITTIRLVKVKATTNNITRGIVNFLNVRGHFAFRVNSTGIWDPTKRIFRKPNQKYGLADIVCCLHGGKFLAVEVKNQITKDRMKRNQEAFESELVKAGGVYYVAKNMFDFIDWYNVQEFNENKT